MQNQEKFQSLLEEFQHYTKQFESLLLSWESLDLARQDQGLCQKYSEEAPQNTAKSLQKDIAFCGRELANVILWLNNSCAFSHGEP